MPKWSFHSFFVHFFTWTSLSQSHISIFHLLSISDFKRAENSLKRANFLLFLWNLTVYQLFGGRMLTAPRSNFRSFLAQLHTLNYVIKNLIFWRIIPSWELRLDLTTPLILQLQLPLQQIIEEIGRRWHFL